MNSAEIDEYFARLSREYMARDKAVSDYVRSVQQDREFTQCLYTDKQWNVQAPESARAGMNAMRDICETSIREQAAELVKNWQSRKT